SITNRNSESFRRVEGGGGRHPLSNYATWLVAGARNHRYRLVSKRAQTRFNLYLRECTGLALIRSKLGQATLRLGTETRESRRGNTALSRWGWRLRTPALPQSFAHALQEHIEDGHEWNSQQR